MAQTIWIHRLANEQRAGADGADYICEHLFQVLEKGGKLNKTKGWNPQDASAKDSSTYRALFCDSCKKNYSPGHVRMAKCPVLV